MAYQAQTFNSEVWQRIGAMSTAIAAIAEMPGFSPPEDELVDGVVGLCALDFSFLHRE